MDLQNAIEPVTTLKARSSELIRRARETGQPIVITQNGKATAVLQDVESYERQRKALLMLKLFAQREEEHRAGRGIDHAEAEARLTKKLEALKRHG